MSMQEPVQEGRIAGQEGIDPDALAERVNEALAPAMENVSDEIARVVAERFAELQSAPADTPSTERRASDTEPEEGETEADPGSASESGQDAGEQRPPGDNGSGDGSDDSDDGSFFSKASSSILSSFLESLRDEGGDQLESIVDMGVDALFSRRAIGAVRNLADQALQAALNDALETIDDPNERYQLYNDSLRTLRPIVRDAVDAMYNDESRDTLKRQLQGAIPSLLHGDFNVAFSMIASALAEVTDDAEDAIGEHGRDVLQVFQQLSTALLEDYVQDTAEEKIDPEEIQQKVQRNADEARETLAGKIESLQDAVKQAQSEFGGSDRGPGGSGRATGQRAGMPPSGMPPHGFPPSGRPPGGGPPTGRPPHGFPPQGLPPAVERRREAEHSGAGSSRRGRR